jgi:hypothetical protein
MLTKPRLVLTLASFWAALSPFTLTANVAMIAGLSCLALVGAQSSPANANPSVPSTRASNVKVPFLTPVTVHVKSEVLSSKVQEGDSVVLQIADDVVVNGYVVMARGADGLAQVESVTPATANSPGQLELECKWVRAVDGSKIGVQGDFKAAGRANSGGGNTATSTLSSGLQAASNMGSNSGALGAVSNLLGSSGGLLSHLGGLGHVSKGNEASIEPDRTISLEIRNPFGVTIASSQKSSQKTSASSASDDSDVK